MAQLTIAVNGRNYTVACDDGDEGQVERTARTLDKRARDLAAQVGKVGDAQLMVMIGMLLIDEMAELRGEAEKAIRAVTDRDHTDRMLAAGIEALAERVAAIADRLDNA